MHQRNSGWDFELQNTHLVLFKTPCDVTQVSVLHWQLGLGSKLNDWYRDANDVPYGNLLIDLLPRADNRLRHCANEGSNPLKLNIPEYLKHSESVDDEHTKYLYSPSVPIVFPQVQKSILLRLFKRFYPVSPRKQNKYAQSKSANFKKTWQNFKASFDYRLWNEQLGSIEGTFWHPKKGYSSKKFLLLSIVNCFDKEQFVLVPAFAYKKSFKTQSFTKQELPKYQPLQNKRTKFIHSGRR